MGENRKLEKSSRIEDNPPLISRDPKSHRRAAALSYDPESDGAPVLAAFGEGHVAEKIVAVARESGVPVVPDPTLSSMLSKIGVGDEIPEELYEAVAKVLLFVSEVDRSFSQRVGAFVT